MRIAVYVCPHQCALPSSASAAVPIHIALRNLASAGHRPLHSACSTLSSSTRCTRSSSSNRARCCGPPHTAAGPASCRAAAASLAAACTSRHTRNNHGEICNRMYMAASHTNLLIRRDRHKTMLMSCCHTAGAPVACTGQFKSIHAHTSHHSRVHNAAAVLLARRDLHLPTSSCSKSMASLSLLAGPSVQASSSCMQKACFPGPVPVPVPIQHTCNLASSTAAQKVNNYGYLACRCCRCLWLAPPATRAGAWCSS